MNIDCILVLLVITISIQIIQAQPPYYVGQQLCSSYSAAECNGTGYCVWKTSCVQLPCYKVTEMNACRPTMGASADCLSLEALSPYYTNVCAHQSEGLFLSQGLLIQKSTSETHAGITINGRDLPTLKITYPSVPMLYEVYTLNVLKATKAQLLDILDIFIQFEPAIELDKFQRFILEQKLVHSLQIIRDDETITVSEKQTLLTKWWYIANLFLKQLRKDPIPFVGQQELATFLSYPLMQLGAQISGQSDISKNYQAKITWTHQYYLNGQIQIVKIPSTYFGLRVLSDIIRLQLYYSDQSVPAIAYTLQVHWSNQDLVTPPNNVYLYSFDGTTQAFSDITGSVGKSCALAADGVSTTCTFTSLPPALTFFFTKELPLCSSVLYDQFCRLMLCSWSGTTCA